MTLDGKSADKVWCLLDFCGCTHVFRWFWMGKIDDRYIGDVFRFDFMDVPMFYDDLDGNSDDLPFCFWRFWMAKCGDFDGKC